MPIADGMWRDNKRFEAADKTAWGAVVEDTTATWLLLMRMHHLKELVTLVFC